MMGSVFGVDRKMKKRIFCGGPIVLALFGGKLADLDLAELDRTAVHRLDRYVTASSLAGIFQHFIRRFLSGNIDDEPFADHRNHHGKPLAIGYCSPLLRKQVD